MEEIAEAMEKLAPITYEARFVAHTIEVCTRDKGMAARLRRADNPATEYQSWEFLASMGIELENEHKRLPFVTIAAAIAKAKAAANGSVPLGRALANCYEDGRESSQARARLRRILACESLPELCRILRSSLTLIESKGAGALNYELLLRQLLRFSFYGQQVKAQWAQEFYLDKAVKAEGEDK